ncbi:MAG: hypothetical protein DHS20C19_23100 [Acidimicrobiales bacterium]|nr:MAG: hypothetical protein DHS20C19_23100 [Acidimicrobiales bacterium]
MAVVTQDPSPQPARRHRGWDIFFGTLKLIAVVTVVGTFVTVVGWVVDLQDRVDDLERENAALRLNIAEELVGANEIFGLVDEDLQFVGAELERNDRLNERQWNTIYWLCDWVEALVGLEDPDFGPRPCLAGTTVPAGE